MTRTYEGWRGLRESPAPLFVAYEPAPTLRRVCFSSFSTALGAQDPWVTVPISVSVAIDGVAWPIGESDGSCEPVVAAG